MLALTIFLILARQVSSISEGAVAHLGTKTRAQTSSLVSLHLEPRGGGAAATNKTLRSTSLSKEAAQEPGEALVHVRPMPQQAVVGQSRLSVPFALGGLLFVVGMGGGAMYYHAFVADHSLTRLKKTKTISRQDTDLVPNFEDVQEVCEQWNALAETGELDVYTCMGLSNGADRFGEGTRSYIPIAIMLFIMHFMLPSLLLAYELQTFTYWSDNQDLTYRLIGFILYIYSVLHMYRGAVDECRSTLLNLALYRNISIWYIGPLLVGEFMNAYTSFTLTLVLFFVFCNTSRPVELLIKCIAINFVTEIDNSWLTEDMRKHAKEKFSELETGILAPESLPSPTRQIKSFEFGEVSPRLQGIVEWLTFILRVGGTLCVGFCLGLLFFVSRQDELCGYFQPYATWPVCKN